MNMNWHVSKGDCTPLESPLLDRRRQISVADPNPEPDPPDPHVFGPPGSGLLVRGMDPDPALDPDPSIIKQKY
jgi:hypothetical protein